MFAIFLKTLPFFMLIGLGYLAGRRGFFTEDATAYLTKFVFYFALSAMLFRFAANLEMQEVWNPDLVLAYLAGTVAVYVIALGVGLIRRQDLATSAVEAQCAVIGNVGFLGIPMLVLLIGPPAIGPLMMVLAVDLIVFSSLIVILITAGRDGHMTLTTAKTVALGLVRNPMIVSISVGLLWSAADWPVPQPVSEFLDILGAAATPGALFAIGASLATKSAERLSIALWLTFCKLALHPIAVAIAILFVWPTDPFTARIAIICAAMPVAGNIFMLAQHYGVAPQRVSAAILVSTIISICTLSAAIAWAQATLP
jgi:predicted permease